MNTKPLVLYGAGGNGRKCLDDFERQGIKPVCYVDKNEKRWHKAAYDGTDILVYSLKEALEMYPDCNIWITIDGCPKAEVEDYLLSNNISKERILNFQEYYKGLGCMQLNSVFVMALVIEFRPCVCIRQDNTEYRLGITTPWHIDFATTFDLFLDKKYSTIDILKSTPEKSACHGCLFLKHGLWLKEGHITYVNLSVTENCMCNFKCFYCNEMKYINNITYNNDDYISAFNIMESKGLVHPNWTTVWWGNGELCVYRKRDEVLDIFERYDSDIATNASIYNERIHSLCKRGKTTLVVSLDSGTRETFKKIKGVDAYEKVTANLEKYSEGCKKSPIRLKYIILDGINNNQDDVDGFFELCKKIRPAIALSADMFNNNPLDSATLQLFNSLVSRLKEIGLSVSITKGSLSDSEQINIFGDIVNV